jgi:uncharacterized protein involved in cysteine biosynthesis
VIGALLRAFGDLGEPALRRVLKIGVIAALGCWMVLTGSAWALIHHAHFFDPAWADFGTGLALGLVVLVLPMLFFSALATFVMSFFLDGAADAIEARHYPELGQARRPPWTETLASSSRFLVVMAGVTAVAALAYLPLLFLGLGLLLNYLVNGYLLGREYFELVASRRLDPLPMRQVFRANLGRLWLGGAAINLMFQVPVLNLAAPLLATAFMAHLARRLNFGPHAA